MAVHVASCPHKDEQVNVLYFKRAFQSPWKQTKLSHGIEKKLSMEKRREKYLSMEKRRDKYFSTHFSMEKYFSMEKLEG